MYYLQSRYYDPNTGRFLNADALVSTGQGLLGNNMFAYCLNNPASYYDPSGMATLSVRCDDSTYFLNGYYGAGGGGGGAAYALPAAGELINKVDERVNNKSGAVTRAGLLTDGYGFYRGRLVVKLDIMEDSAFSFGVIFTGPNPDDNLLAHEYGHTVHLSQIGIADYTAKVVVPSVTSFWIYRENPYYTSQPWEYIAEYFGKTALPSNGYLACADELAIIYWIFTVLP